MSFAGDPRASALKSFHDSLAIREAMDPEERASVRKEIAAFAPDRIIGLQSHEPLFRLDAVCEDRRKVVGRGHSSGTPALRRQTPVLSPEEARRVLDAIDVSTHVGLRDRALIALMVFRDRWPAGPQARHRWVPDVEAFSPIGSNLAAE